MMMNINGNIDDDVVKTFTFNERINGVNYSIALQVCFDKLKELLNNANEYSFDRNKLSVWKYLKGENPFTVFYIVSKLLTMDIDIKAIKLINSILVLDPDSLKEVDEVLGGLFEEE